MGEMKTEIVGKISKGEVFRGLLKRKSILRFRVESEEYWVLKHKGRNE